MSADDATTVAELRAAIHRQRAALHEAGRHDLAAKVYVAITDDRLWLRFTDPPTTSITDPDAMKALSLDPGFEFAGPVGEGTQPPVRGER